MSATTSEVDVKAEMIDMLTFTRIMKVFTILPQGSDERVFRTCYEELNHAPFPNMKKCLRILHDNGNITYKQSLVAGPLRMIEPTDKIKPVLKQLKMMNPDVVNKDTFWPDTATSPVEIQVPLLQVSAEIREKKSCNIRITYINRVVNSTFSPLLPPRQTFFQIQGEENRDALEKLTAEMQVYYFCNPARTAYVIPNLTDLRHGDIIAAPCSENLLLTDIKSRSFGKTYYRAMVQKQLPRNKVQVFYIDFGDTGIVDLAKLYRLKDNYRKLPCQAIEGHVVGLDGRKKLDHSSVMKMKLLQTLRADILDDFEEIGGNLESNYWPRTVEIQVVDTKTGKTLPETFAPK